MNKLQILHEEINYKIKEYFNEKVNNHKFVKGESKIHYAGRVFDEKELINAIDASLEFWLTEGRYSKQFEKKISTYLDVENVLLTNSGSSANLLALASLTSLKLGEKRLRPGDEVITVAAGFPSTVTPILLFGLTPVFIDIEIPTYNINIEMMRQALTPRTRCVFIAHTLGNPFNVDEVMKFAKENDLWVIEDNCDAFGSLYKGEKTGAFGHFSTISFYPAHHITTGEGGAVCTNDPDLFQIAKSFRDWGRDCFCGGGQENSCGKRFTQQFGDLPYGYDHKYIYSEVGFNLKMTDIQAAIGAAQMEKLPNFVFKRKENFIRWKKIFEQYTEYFILPEATIGSNPAWFSFIISLKEKAPFSRDQFIKHLNIHKIETRNLFAGNITKQPGFKDKNYIISGNLYITDFVMNNTFFLGTYPGLTEEMFEYSEEIIYKFFKS